MRHMLYFFFSVLLVAGTGHAQFVKRLDGSLLKADSIDALVNRLLPAAKVNGVCIAVLNDNKPLYEKTFGYSNAQEKTLLDTATVMYAASLSKAVFSFIVLQLVQNKQLELDKPLFTYFPDFHPTGDVYANLIKDPRWLRITARMCLSHTTGMQNLWWMNPLTGETDTISGVKLYFMPGTRYAYSGEGLKFLQKAVENITGVSLTRLADSLVFTPAQMTRTSYIWDNRFEDNSAWGHDENGKAMGKKRAGKPGAAGSMVTTLADYSRFIAWVLQGKGLQKKYYDLMISPQVRIHSKQQFPTLSPDTTTANDKIKLSYGLGWGVLQTPYGKGFFKEGHDDYWRNYNINFPDKKMSIIILSNSANGEGIFKELLETIIGDHYTPIDWENYLPYNAAR